MRHRHLAVLLTLAASLTACSADEGSSTATPDPATSAATSGATSAGASSTATEDVIPDGSYSKTVTRAQARAAGITDPEFLREVGQEGTTYTWKFAGDRWTEFATVGSGAPEPGDGGTLTYGDHHIVSATSESDGCPGCRYDYEWRVDGDRLVLDIVGHQSTDSPEDVAMVRLVTEGEFTRDS